MRNRCHGGFYEDAYYNINDCKVFYTFFGQDWFKDSFNETDTIKSISMGIEKSHQKDLYSLRLNVVWKNIKHSHSGNSEAQMLFVDKTLDDCIDLFIAIMENTDARINEEFLKAVISEKSVELDKVTKDLNYYLNIMLDPFKKV